jgi:hypothetical protein
VSPWTSARRRPDNRINIRYEIVTGVALIIEAVVLFLLASTRARSA